MSVANPLRLEALGLERLKALRKRSSQDTNRPALELTREMGLAVAINIIADPDWDAARIEAVRQWAMSVPEIVNLTVQTPDRRHGRPEPETGPDEFRAQPLEAPEGLQRRQAVRDHLKPVEYFMPEPEHKEVTTADRKALYAHVGRPERRSRPAAAG